MNHLIIKYWPFYITLMILVTEGTLERKMVVQPATAFSALGNKILHKTMVFNRATQLCKKHGSNHMCFSTESRPGPSRTQAGASRPLQTTAPAHNPPQYISALGSQVSRLPTFWGASRSIWEARWHPAASGSICAWYLQQYNNIYHIIYCIEYLVDSIPWNMQTLFQLFITYIR